MTFNLDQIEFSRITIFKKKHQSCPMLGITPGPFTYSFTPTTIAVFIEIKCTHCLEEENITNVETI